MPANPAAPADPAAPARTLPRAPRVLALPRVRPRADRALARCPPRGAKRATVIGAGSFPGRRWPCSWPEAGCARRCRARTAEQAARLEAEHENNVYLPGVELPAQLPGDRAGLGRGGTRRLRVPSAVPSSGLGDVIAMLDKAGLDKRAAVVSVAGQGPRPTGRGLPPTTVRISARFGAHRVALPRRTGARPGDGE